MGTIKIPVIPFDDPFDEKKTEDAAGKSTNGTNGTYKKKKVPGGGGKPETYTPEKS